MANVALSRIRFTEEGCDENPFGVGVVYDEDLSVQGVPKLIPMLTEEEDKENVDPQIEIDFGREKQAHRATLLAVLRYHIDGLSTTVRKCNEKIEKANVQ